MRVVTEQDQQHLEQETLQLYTAVGFKRIWELGKKPGTRTKTIEHDYERKRTERQQWW